ncbi:GH25 family lysozyme [Latilactobacillus sakei]|uniref:GH25 family lysozyme n=3 Tax=Latilactobacillus TaxID=2767885 RepID=UPI003133CEE9
MVILNNGLNFYGGISFEKKNWVFLLCIAFLSILPIFISNMNAVQASTNLFADVASYQPDNLAFFQSLKQKGVKAVNVKLTQGDWYTNPKAKKAGLLVNAYHYAEFNSSVDVTSPIREAAYFVAAAKRLGIESNRVMVLDIEDEQNSKDSNVITKDINTFEDYVSANGYAKTSTYVMRYWLTIQRVLDAQLHDKNLWVAEYGTSQCGYPCEAWQFTSTWDNNGNKIDMSYDYNGRFTEDEDDGFKITEKQSVNKNVQIASHDYSLFNTPSPLNGAKLLINGRDLTQSVVHVVAKYKVSNGEYYYNFKYGDRYYWANTRAFTDVFKVVDKESMNKDFRISLNNYGFYNTPSPLPGTKLLLAGSQVDHRVVHVVARYKVSNGEYYYNFKYNDRYYWCNSRAFAEVEKSVQKATLKLDKESESSSAESKETSSQESSNMTKEDSAKEATSQSSSTSEISSVSTSQVQKESESSEAVVNGELQSSAVVH